MPHRNPYLILGVDFGATHDEARRRFAHAARRVRRQGGVWEIEDLNWALHEVEALESNPADGVALYRVPADERAFVPAGDGVFRPRPVPMARSVPPDPAARAALADAAAAELHALLVHTGAAHVDVASVYGGMQVAR